MQRATDSDFTIPPFAAQLVRVGSQVGEHPSHGNYKLHRLRRFVEVMFWKGGKNN